MENESGLEARLVPELIHDAGYFNSKVGFQDYMHQKQDKLAEDLIRHFKFDTTSKITDFGAATGALVKEFLDRGYTNIVGTDVRDEAVKYGKRELGLGNNLQFYNRELLYNPSDYVLFLDTLEFVPSVEELETFISFSAKELGKNVIVRVPIAKTEGENFALEVSRNETRVHCHSKEWWINLFKKNGLTLDEELKLESIYSGEGVFAGSFKKCSDSETRVATSASSRLIFERGYYEDSTISNYIDYKEKKYDGLAQDLIQHLQLEKEDQIIDYGAAYGFLVYELVKRGFTNVRGTDISYYGVEFGKNKLKLGDRLQHYNLELLYNDCDHVFFLDVLEHISSINDISKYLSFAARNLRKSVVARIPIAEREGENYFLEVSRKDKTHVQCHSKAWWYDLFENNGLVLENELALKNIYASTGVLAASFRKK